MWLKIKLHMVNFLVDIHNDSLLIDIYTFLIYQYEKQAANHIYD